MIFSFSMTIGWEYNLLVNSFPVYLHSLVKLYEFFINDAWNVDKLKRYLLKYLVEDIVDIPIKRPSDDITYWVHSSNGNFTTKNVWESIQ